MYIVVCIVMKLLKALCSKTDSPKSSSTKVEESPVVTEVVGPASTYILIDSESVSV